MWVPYFLGFEAPEVVLKVMQSLLVAGLESDVLGNQSLSLVDLCMTACVRARVSGAPKKRNVLDFRWLTLVLVTEREVISRRMSIRLHLSSQPNSTIQGACSRGASSINGSTMRQRVQGLLAI